MNDSNVLEAGSDVQKGIPVCFGANKELIEALSKAQAEFTTLTKDSDNPFFQSKYTELHAYMDMVRPILAKHGLVVLQNVCSFDGSIRIQTLLYHKDGGVVNSGWLQMKPDKATIQGLGSAITYGRRYSLAPFLGLVSHEEDDDGNEASGNKTKTPPSKKSPVKEKKNTVASGKATKPAKTSKPPAEETTKEPFGTQDEEPVQKTPDMPKLEASEELYRALLIYTGLHQEDVVQVLYDISKFPGKDGEVSMDLDKLKANKVSATWAGKLLRELREEVKKNGCLQSMPVDCQEDASACPEVASISNDEGKTVAYCGVHGDVPCPYGMGIFFD